MNKKATVVSSKQLDYAINKTREVWELEPHRYVRMPLENRNPISVDALWTDKGLRPSFTNLAFIIQSCANKEESKIWKQQFASLPIRGWLLVINELYLLQYYNELSQIEEIQVPPDNLTHTLNSSKSYLFTPKALSKFRTGQLSLADLEENISERSFSFVLRQRQQLDLAFNNGISKALRQISNKKLTKELRCQMQGHTIRVAIAFLAARILEDKGFFSSNSLTPTNNPRELLKKTVNFTNGFFEKASNSISCLEEFLPNKTDKILQSLSANLGDRVTFALVDHRDVGLLYERAIGKLPKNLEGKDWSDLQRHYTPVMIAEKMLESLPLERLRPEERVIFDPAAGSGSLLLAATSRLARMSDIPESSEERARYLENHVMGNDLDEYANLVTKLRYLLAKESLGETVPFPCPTHFTNDDYEQLTKDDFAIKPRVVVANPPFAEDGNTQRAAIFIEKALSWLDKGSQFAFVLPQSFLTNTTHGLPAVRKLLTEKCQISEVWQLPEGTVGIDAAQDVCVISGIVGNSQIRFPTTARAVLSRAKISNTRDNGFLGSAWISTLDSNDKTWSSITTPTISIPVPTVPLGNLFYIFNGVNPGKYGKIYPPVEECPDGVECKLNWALQWRDQNRLWANPEKVPPEKRWRRYGREYLEGARLSNRNLFDLNKILVGRDVNRSSVNPIAVQLDTVGLCPDNHIYCILPVQQVDKYTHKYTPTDVVPDRWSDFSDEEQRLWLLGLFASKLCNALSLKGRNTRAITVPSLCHFPLPTKVDRRIIQITRKIIERDQQNLPIPMPDDLRVKLDKVVEESYGNPHWEEISRTGTPTGLEEWKYEHIKPTMTVRGRVLKVSKDNSKIFLYLNGLLDDEEKQWLPVLPEIPGWALDGTAFDAEISEDVETFAELRKRPWAIRNFRHTPRPYLTDQELRDELGL